MAGVLCRIHDVDQALGRGDRERLATAGLLSGVSTWDDPLAEWLIVDLAPELAVQSGDRSWRLPQQRVALVPQVALGSLTPLNHAGDSEEGLISPRLRLDGAIYPGILELTASPELVYNQLEGRAQTGVALRDLWAGVDVPVGETGHFRSGAGVRDRWFGPGHHGSLVLTDNARPAPSAALGWTGRVPRLGRFAADVGAGWLNAERTDVQHPGWLFMDLRWVPHPWVELGASRIGIFGGQDRPTPRLGQLILPTDPHVYDDPDKLEADQDELAAIDMRGRLPLGRWLGSANSTASVRIEYLEAWWQYGGEDMIMQRTLGIPYPALAGVANLYGGELAVAHPAGLVLLNIEVARLLDDYFRWYTGHRIYHQGFTQEGLSMGHAVGGDAFDGWISLTLLGTSWGGELWVERIQRVGVVGAEGTHIFALMVDEERERLGLRGWHWWQGRWWTLSVSVEQVEGLDFVAGASGWTWRLALGG